MVQNSNKQVVWQYILLTFITALAAILRFYKLGEWSFWGDELITVRSAPDAINGSILTPFSYIIIGEAMKLFGVSEWSARLVPALIGVASIPLFYFPIRRVTNPRTALVAVLLLAVSPWHIYWSQNARFYTPLLLFYTLSLFTFYIALEEDRPLYLLLSLVFAGLAVKERLFSLMLAPILVGYIILLFVMRYDKPRGYRFRNIGVLLVPGLLALPLIGWQFIQDPQRWFNKFSWINNNPLWISASVAYYIGVPIICLGIFSALYFFTQRNRFALLLTLGAILPICCVTLLSLVQYSASRYVFIALTSWLLLAAMSVDEFLRLAPKNVKILGYGVASMLILFSLSEDVLYYQYQNGNRDDWKAAFTWVNQQSQPGDVIVSANQKVGEYYATAQPVNMAELEPHQIDELGDRVWIVEDMNVREKWPEMYFWLRENAELAAEMDVHVRARTYLMRVYVYEPEAADPGLVSQEETRRAE